MIIVAPYAKKMRNGADKNPKDYPYWWDLLLQIDEHVIQIGVDGEGALCGDVRYNLSLSELDSLVQECRTWISVDSFFQHFCWDLGKPGIVLFGQSDPNIFGHPENVNLLKSRDNLRMNQFWWWEQTPYIEEAFVKPDVVLEALAKF